MLDDPLAEVLGEPRIELYVLLGAVGPVGIEPTTERL